MADPGSSSASLNPESSIFIPHAQKTGTRTPHHDVIHNAEPDSTRFHSRERPPSPKSYKWIPRSSKNATMNVDPSAPAADHDLSPKRALGGGRNTKRGARGRGVVGVQTMRDRPNQPSQSNGKKSPNVCKLCNITFTSIMHLRSDQHQHNLRLRNEQRNSNEESFQETKIASPTVSSKQSKSSRGFTEECTVCNIRFTSESDRVAHMQGKRHQRVVSSSPGHNERFRPGRQVNQRDFSVRSSNDSSPTVSSKQSKSCRGFTGECAVCNMRFASESDRVAHMQGKRHLRAVSSSPGHNERFRPERQVNQRDYPVRSSNDSRFDRRHASPSLQTNFKGKSRKVTQFAPARQQKSRDLSTHESDTESESSEDEISGDSSMLAEIITRKLAKGKYECMICFAQIPRKAAIWSCTNCWALFHIGCIRRWVAKSTEDQSFRCPGCQYVHVGHEVEYKCFCGKTTEPENDRFATAHSCGNTCERSRGAECPHSCTLPCHPGPCVPCTRMGRERKCACGNTTYHLRCGETEKFPRTCDGVCDKPLNCGKHRCEWKCHTVKCAPCDQTETQSCICGKESSERPCGSGKLVEDGLEGLRYSCEKVCEKKLECEHHQCELICHSGPCVCPRATGFPQKCACGKKELDRFPFRKDCLAMLPSCGDICDKPLGCGQHRCKEICHDSPCEECTEQCTDRCRCGRRTYSNPCTKRHELLREHEESQAGVQPSERTSLFMCTGVCKQNLSCNRHRCNRVCCEARSKSNHVLHVCLEPCSAPLPCGLHNCEHTCHQGACPPCGHGSGRGLACRCGAVRVQGFVPCGTEQPECSKQCSVERNCGHPCIQTCHSGDCPPCSYYVTKSCVGGHNTPVPNVYCHSKNVSCGKLCGKTRLCGAHKCNRKCHPGPCDREERNPLDPCNQKCLLVMPCKHPCQLKCHVPRPCLSNRCSVSVDVWCSCGRFTKRAPCHTAPASRRLPQCPPKCGTCRRAEAFRDALGIDDKKLGNSYDRKTPGYMRFSRALMDAALKKQDFVRNLERDFVGFILTEESNVLYLPAMSSDKRWLVYQLVAHYSMSAQALDSSGQYKAVEVEKDFTSNVCSLKLTEAMLDYKREEQSKRTGWPWGCVLTFPQLDLQVDSRAIQRRTPGIPTDFKLIRSLGKSFALFQDSASMLAANQSISSAGSYKAHPASISEELIAARIQNDLNAKRAREKAYAAAEPDSPVRPADGVLRLDAHRGDWVSVKCGSNKTREKKPNQTNASPSAVRSANKWKAFDKF
eukprot:763496_1